MKFICVLSGATFGSSLTNLLWFTTQGSDHNWLVFLMIVSFVVVLLAVIYDWEL